jgi:hypothetical protein
VNQAESSASTGVPSDRAGWVTGTRGMLRLG